MATFYLDYEGGSDAADGTSFANRWKTITSGATAARIAPGDTIRVMGSPAPTSLGINATWTNKSATVTLASALNVLITNCDTAWTASANVTCTADTGIYRTSTGSAKHAVAAGFTTGKAAYLGLGGAQDYSAYQGITLWVRTATKALAAGEASIRLCSDTIGAVTVDNLALPAISQTGQWVPVHIDKGSALGNSIQSIALYIDTDNGAIDLYFDNISTTKAVGNDCLTLKTLIGKNTGTELWWALRSINGTTLGIDLSPSSTVGYTPAGYYGTTESVATYIRQTIPTALVVTSVSAVQAVQDTGSSGNPITFSGGWNRTDMSTQTLETWFDGQSGNGYGLHVSTGINYITLEKVNLVRYRYGLVLNNCNNFTCPQIYICHCDTDGVSLGNTSTVNFGYIYTSGNHYGFSVYGSRTTVTSLTSVSNGTTGVDYGYGLWFSNLIRGLTIGTAVLCNNRDGINGNNVEVGHLDFGTVTASDNRRHGFIVDWAGAYNWTVRSLTCLNNTSAGFYKGKSAGPIVVGSYTSSGNTYAVDAGLLASDHWHICTILKSSMAEATKLYTAGASSELNPGGVVFQNYNGVAGDHRFYMIGRAEIFSESSVRHTASGLAWKVSPLSTTYVTSVWPVWFQVGKVSLAANITKTITIWVRRTNTGITAKLVVRGGQLDGITTDQVATAAAAQDTWEQLSVNVTPTIAGVIDVEVQVYGGSTYSVYVDDLGVS